MPYRWPATLLFSTSIPCLCSVSIVALFPPPRPFHPLIISLPRLPPKSLFLLPFTPWRTSLVPSRPTPMPSSNSGCPSRPRVHGHTTAAHNERSRLMRWLSKLFKGTGYGVSNGRHTHVIGENLLHRPAKPDDQPKAENEDMDRAIALSLAEDAQKCNVFCQAVTNTTSLCYKEFHHPKCDVCYDFIPPNSTGLIEYRAHPFWGQKYCPSHENDGTPRCCSCERMESRSTRYISLGEGRSLCLECLDSAIMDTGDCQPLYHSIRDYYEGMNMRIDQQIPMLLVERVITTCLKQEAYVLQRNKLLALSSISKRPKTGGNKVSNMQTYPQKLTRKCEVTAILVLYGLPRLLTGSILARELMHGWLRLKVEDYQENLIIISKIDQKGAELYERIDLSTTHASFIGQVCL